VNAKAAAFVELQSLDQLAELYTTSKQFPQQFILGGGSNLLFVDDYPGLVIYPQLNGIEILFEDDQQVRLKVAASENWHDFVRYCLKSGYYGLENLALIPGTVGAAPVQNIGAYGVEVKQLVHSVDCFDFQTGQVEVFSKDQCQFGYRDSLIKRAGQGRYLVTGVDFNLSKTPQLTLDYQPLKSQFANQPSITPQHVFDKVCEIRRSKLPDPKALPNAGSFFKNPVVSSEDYHRLKKQFDDLVAYPQTDNQYKLAAGWLIDQAGFKGKVVDKVGVHTLQALVLVNYSDTDGANIWRLAQQIIQVIKDKFQIKLEPEVRLLPPSVIEGD